MPYTTLREAGACVRRKEVFTGNNIYGRWDSDNAGVHRRYIVYSYGTHFPMYIWDEDTGLWYGNSDRYSCTTSRHQSACAPPHIAAWYDTARMQQFAVYGVVPVIKARIAAGVTMIPVAQSL